MMLWVKKFFMPPMKTRSLVPCTMARTLPTAPVTPISASPLIVAAVATGDEGMKTRLKSRSYFLKQAGFPGDPRHRLRHHLRRVQTDEPVRRRSGAARFDRLSKGRRVSDRQIQYFRHNGSSSSDHYG